MAKGRLLAAAAVAAALVVGVPAVEARAAQVRSPIDTLRSYSFTLSIKAQGSGTGLASSAAVTSSGTFVRPQNQDCTVTASLGPLKISQQIVTVGSKSWVGTPGNLAPAKASSFDWADFCPTTKEFWSNFALAVPAGSPTSETVGGVAALRYDPADGSNSLQGFKVLGDLGSGVTISGVHLWFAKVGNWPVRAQFALGSTTQSTCDSLVSDTPVKLDAPCSAMFDYALSGANDKTIKITAPKASKR